MFTKDIKSLCEKMFKKFLLNLEWKSSKTRIDLIVLRGTSRLTLPVSHDTNNVWQNPLKRCNKFFKLDSNFRLMLNRRFTATEFVLLICQLFSRFNQKCCNQKTRQNKKSSSKVSAAHKMKRCWQAFCIWRLILKFHCRKMKDQWFCYPLLIAVKLQFFQSLNSFVKTVWR